MNTKITFGLIATVFVVMVGYAGNAQISEGFSASAAYNKFYLSPGETETQYWGVSNILDEPIFVIFWIDDPTVPGAEGPTHPYNGTNIPGSELLSFPVNATIQPKQRLNVPITVEVPLDHDTPVSYYPNLQVWKLSDGLEDGQSGWIINQYYTNKMQIHITE